MLKSGSRAGAAAPKVLVIGGLDPSAGAGVVLDAFAAANFGAFPYAVVTAVTAQNSGGVGSISAVDAEMVSRQIEAVLAEGSVAAVKTGMIPTIDVADAVIELIGDLGVPLVIDPVLAASDGTPLFEGDIGEYARRFASKATLLTPNLAEAEALSGHRLSGEVDMSIAGEALMALGSKWVLLKGGHLEGELVDLLMGPGVARAYRGDKKSREMRGTGCLLASSIAALVATGAGVESAVSRAIDFVKSMMESSEAIGLGAHQVPLHRVRFGG